MINNIINPMPKPYCQKVLPLVYDDSLSYYEMLCKLMHKTNDIIDVINDKLESMIRNQLDKLFIDSMYDAETETLILILNMEE